MHCICLMETVNTLANISIIFYFSMLRFLLCKINILIDLFTQNTIEVDVNTALLILGFFLPFLYIVYPESCFILSYKPLSFFLVTFLYGQMSSGYMSCGLRATLPISQSPNLWCETSALWFLWFIHFCVSLTISAPALNPAFIVDRSDNRQPCLSFPWCTLCCGMAFVSIDANITINHHLGTRNNWLTVFKSNTLKLIRHKV